MGRAREAGWSFLMGTLARLPQGALSRVTGRLADVKLPPMLRAPVLGTFARWTGIDPSEAARPIREYVSVNDFFVRELRDGVRLWPDDPRAIGSPVDGIIGQLGTIREGKLVQAKGRLYSAERLLDEVEAAAALDGGRFITLYLSPRHYHRIHAPVSGSILRARHVPGSLLPVNEPAVVRFDDLFPRNERVVLRIESEAGVLAVVAVGAYNVGRISVAFDPEWGGDAAARTVTNRYGARAATRVYDPPHRIRRGEQIMAFHLGSTVVLLFEPDRVTLRGDLEIGREVRLGEAIATGV